jgi:hypothetical protein
MRPILLRAWLAGVVAFGLCPGCKTASPEPSYPSDPLLLSKRPVEGKPEQDRPRAQSHGEPQEPPLPPPALVSDPATCDLSRADQSLCLRTESSQP